MTNDLTTAEARRPFLVEFAAVFFLGVVLMKFFYLEPNGGDPGVPGHDSFYHIRMATLIPEHGLLDDFPWLEFCWFTKDGTFVSHHYGFHVLLLPFVKTSEWLTGDALAGGRWAMTFFFGLSLALLHLILARSGVRWRWLWLILFLFIPPHFFGRHAFVRAIAPALTFVMLILFFMYQKRYGWLALTLAAFNHLYLGALLYSPVIMGLHVFACSFGNRDERSIPWKLIAFSSAGWLLGALTYPYSSGMVEFLKLQVLGTGLAPDIEVGNEWKPYSGVWTFAKTIGLLALPWLGSMALRLRTGPRLTANELSSVLISMAFLVLTLKARRFMEYWPILCLLSTALISRPFLDRVHEWFEENPRIAPRTSAALRSAIAGLVLLGMLIVADRNDWMVPAVAQHGALWAMLGSLYIGTILHRIWTSRSGTQWSNLALWVGLFGGAAYILWAGFFSPSGVPGFLKENSLLSLVALGAMVLFVGVQLIYIARKPVLAASVTGEASTSTSQFRVARSMAVITTGLAVMATMATLGAKSLSDRQSEISCGYNLPKTKAAMEFLKANSEPGDIVFTDDWDIFPLFFYYNTKNHFIVGLDPKFTHHKDPELWERYIKISRGQVPSTIKVEGDQARSKKELRVRLEDIRDHFRARFVVTDGDHKKLARALANADGFAELIYPGKNYAQVENDPFLIFRIKDGSPVALPFEDDGQTLFLSRLTPSWVEQGWGNLSLDHSVSGTPLQIGEETFDYGLGTHAPSRIDFDIPEGFEYFEAKVGIDAAARGRGSVNISVLLDGQLSHNSVLEGLSNLTDIKLDLSGAKTLSLVADCTEDGQKYDHVDWAMARLTRNSQ